MLPDDDALDGSAPVAVVTGGARRVGARLALTLAEAGCDVCLTWHTAEGAAHEVVERIRRLGRRAMACRLDLDDLDGAARTADGWRARLPRLDVLVHNAARYARTPLAGVTAEAIVGLHRVNALAPLLLTARLAPLLRESPLPGGGAVVCIGDIHAMGRPRRDHAAYAMSKAALVEMVQSLARDLAPDVRVNGVAPGVVAWPEAGPEADPALHARYLERVPLGRIGTADDLAEAVRWLALDARFVTGTFMRVDGGRALV